MKRILFTCICFGYVVFSHCQSLPEKNTLFLFLGPALTVSRDVAFDHSSFSPAFPRLNDRITKFGASFGLGVHHNFNRHISLTLRLLSEQKGDNDKAKNYDFSSGQPVYQNAFGENTTTTYLTLSVIPQFRFGRGFNVGAGTFI